MYIAFILFPFVVPVVLVKIEDARIELHTQGHVGVQYSGVLIVLMLCLRMLVRESVKFRYSVSMLSAKGKLKSVCSKKQWSRE